MPAPYFVILDNTTVDEPLKPGLPYWSFPLLKLPTLHTAGRFVDDVLYQSELWANAGATGEWVSLRLLRGCHMCPHCGHLQASMDELGDPLHIVWFIARNPQPQVMGHEAALHLGLWHEAYRQHRCPVNLLATTVSE